MLSNITQWWCLKPKEIPNKNITDFHNEINKLYVLWEGPMQNFQKKKNPTIKNKIK